MKSIRPGVYPTMITPYDKEGKVDFEAVKRIVEWYIGQGVDGIFAVCQSSEMFFLSEDERAELAKTVVETAKGRVSIVASGHVSDEIEDQIRELKRIQAAGADALVLVSNRLATEDEDDDVLIANMNRILEAIPDAVFGVYECPHPYKRLLSDKVLEAMAQSGRFDFIKDTCCDAELIAHRVKVLDGRVGLFNANSATFLETLRAGVAGFSGVMANLHPELYEWLFRHYAEYPEKAEKLSAFLSVASSTVERGMYPATAKYHMNQVGVPMEVYCRCRDSEIGPLMVREMKDLLTLEKMFDAEFPL